MGLATGSVGVTVIITADFDFLEFLLQKLKVAFEKSLEIGFHAQGKVRQIWRHNILCHCLFYPSFLNFVRGIGHREVLLEIDFAFENEKFSCIGREGLLRKVGMDLILISLLQRLMSISFRMAGRGANYRPKRVDNHLWVSLVKMDIRIWI